MQKSLCCLHILQTNQVWAQSSRCSCELEHHTHIWAILAKVLNFQCQKYRPWVSVFKPSPRNLWVLLIHCQGKVLKVLLQLVCHQQAGRASTHANNVQVPLGMDRASKTLHGLKFRCGIVWKYEVCHCSDDDLNVRNLDEI